MRDPFEELMTEHDIILKVLKAIEAAGSQDVGIGFYEKVVDFVVKFADGCHHGKEENHLFPMLEKSGIPRHMGPIGVMWEEHETGRALVKTMSDAVAAGDIDVLRRESLAYAVLMQEHIMKENEVLFPMGRGMISPEDLQTVRDGFDTVETPGVCHKHYGEIADDLLEQVEVAV